MADDAEKLEEFEVDLTIAHGVTRQIREHVALEKQVAIINERLLFDDNDVMAKVDDSHLMAIIRFVLDRDKYRYRIYGPYVFIALNDTIDLDAVIAQFEKGKKSAYFLRITSRSWLWTGILLGMICYFHFALLYSNWFMMPAAIFIAIGVGTSFALRSGMIKPKPAQAYWKMYEMITVPPEQQNDKAKHVKK